MAAARRHALRVGLELKRCGRAESYVAGAKAARRVLKRSGPSAHRYKDTGMLPVKAPTGSCHMIASINTSTNHAVVDLVTVDVMRAVVQITTV